MPAEMTAKGDMTPEKVEKAQNPRVKAMKSGENTAFDKLVENDLKFLASEKAFEDQVSELDAKHDVILAEMRERRAAKLTSGPPCHGVGTSQLKGFWLTVLKRSEDFRDLVKEYDEPILESLQDIKYEPLEKGKDKALSGYKLHFHFVENDYFTNTVLTKTYRAKLANDWDTSVEYMTIEVAEPIDWKPGMDVTVEVKPKKVKGGGKKKAKAKAKGTTVARASFFRIFFRNLGEGLDLPTDVEDEEDEAGGEDSDKMNEYMDDDAQCAETLRDQILNHPVRYFTGEAGDDEDDDDDDDDDDE